jgi:hypothetical protein
MEEEIGEEDEQEKNDHGYPRDRETPASWGK